MKKRTETLKIRPECAGCAFLSGLTPEEASCASGGTPTCYRKKKPCGKREEAGAGKAGQTAAPTETEAPAAEDTGHDGHGFMETTAPVTGHGPAARGDDGAGKAVAYVDGSYNEATGCFGAGAFLMIGGRTEEIRESARDTYGGRQIRGEILAAETACRKALDAGCRGIEIVYDYMGVEMWPTGRWNADKEYARSYAESMRDMMRKGLSVTFRHVTGHGGDHGNERADRLAKEACGLGYLPEPELPGGTYEPDVPSDVAPKCREAILRFYRNGRRSFKDYMSLRVYGRDAYSEMGLSELMSWARGNRCVPDVEPALMSPCIRWMMRGLLPEDAVRKANVDAEVAANCERSGRGGGKRHS